MCIFVMVVIYWGENSFGVFVVNCVYVGDVVGNSG